MNLKTSAQLLLNGQFKIIEFDQGGIPAFHALKNVAINNTLWNLIPSINENNCKRELDYCLKIQKPVSFEVYLPEFSSLFCFFFYPFKDGLGCVINNLSAAVTSDDKREELMNELVQRNRDLEQFTYIVSHNVNAPLATLIGFTELLKSNLNERDRSFILTSLEDSVHKMDSLVKDINEILNEVGHGWTRDPFGGELDGDRIYGRGACDMKGGLAASVIAAEAFLAARPGFRGAIEISATADEETGGYGGVAWLAERGYFSPAKVQHVIIPEPLHKDRICMGHRGVWWAEVETHGRIAHGSMPFLGDSAIRHMGAVLEEIEGRLYPLLATKRTEMPVVPEGVRQSTLNINSIHGGEAEPAPGSTALPAPCVADRCRIVIDRRFLIEEDLAHSRRGGARKTRCLASHASGALQWAVSP